MYVYVCADVYACVCVGRTCVYHARLRACEGACMCASAYACARVGGRMCEGAHACALEGKGYGRTCVRV